MGSILLQLKSQFHLQQHYNYNTQIHNNQHINLFMNYPFVRNKDSFHFAANLMEFFIFGIDLHFLFFVF